MSKNLDLFPGLFKPPESAPIKATVDHLARAFALHIREKSKEVILLLTQGGAGPVDPKSPESLWFALECLIFSWFLFEVMIWRSFGPHADAIRDKLASHLYNPFLKEGLPNGQWREFERRRMTRFTEYYEALKSDKGVEQLGWLASRRITASETPNLFPGVMLGAAALAFFKAYDGFAGKFEVTD